MFKLGPYHRDIEIKSSAGECVIQTKKLALIASAVAIVLAAVLFAGAAMNPGGGSGSATRTVTLAPTELTDAVSATGTVYSNHADNVYSDLSYTVKDNLVE